MFHSSSPTRGEVFWNNLIKEQVKKIKNYLEEHEIPYDEILIVDKPIVKFYIDDSAIRYNGSWKDVVEEMKERIQWVMDVIFIKI